jgi:uncharacterized protein
MIRRKVENILLEMAKHFPVISLTGPRQSGKTTLAKTVFKDYSYVNLENIQNRQFALDDPRGFIRQYKEEVIIDEAQYAPDLFSYIQETVDENRINGRFILIGSRNFLLSQSISQSLAGRTAVFTLYPFSYSEIKETDYGTSDLDELIANGLYPAIYSENLDPVYWYLSYINTYIERDVRNILNVSNLSDFQRFLKICASRTAQIVNLSSLAAEIGISHPTVKSWISVLEGSHIIYLLQPYFRNFGKRLIKSPKLYFLDTGLVCSLLGITGKDQVRNHFMKGALFENFIITELIKERSNQFLPPNLWFWRDNVGNEIDCIQQDGDTLKLIEIKSGETVNQGWFKSFGYFDRVETEFQKKYFLIYGGYQNQQRSDISVLGWKNLPI